MRKTLEDYVKSTSINLINKNKSRKLNYLTKRAFDIFTASVGLTIGMPLLALIGFLVRASSEGPIIYRQERIGLNGRSFTMYKFRTMYNGAENDFDKIRKELGKEDTLYLYLDYGDPRIVNKLSAFLREHGLDELPQLYNVLKGEMSICGNRPVNKELADKIIEQYGDKRFQAVPGITGCLQISDRKELIDEDRIRIEEDYSTAYQEGRFWRKDLSTLLKTPFVLIEGY